MTIAISGICGFVGSTLARCLVESNPSRKVFGFDNFSRPGSQLNRAWLNDLGVTVLYADVRQPGDIESLPQADWVIDAAANPSVLAGVDGLASSRQLLDNNLGGTINLLEYAKRHDCGFILLSTSRVYSIDTLSGLPLEVNDGAFRLAAGVDLPAGVSARGVSEQFSTAAPISLYGSSKLCSEILALEFAETFGLNVWINRCGVLAGGGQFGTADQGIFSYWINSYLRRQSLRYIGFGGQGHQVRDCLHPSDLVPILEAQMTSNSKAAERVVNISGGAENCLSLYNLSKWCAERFGDHEIAGDMAERKFDVPWLVLDSSAASAVWNWRPQVVLDEILDQIARHAESHPDWLGVSAQLR